MNSHVELKEINNTAKYWLVRADGGRYYDDFKHNHFISVHHNELTLEKLTFEELLLTEEKTLEKYKETVSTEHQSDNWSKQKVTSIAKRLHYFIESMSIGDYVIVPSHKSNSFLIGEIVSEAYEIKSETISNLNHTYETVDDLKRRKINWINEVLRSKINSKLLYSTLTMHQAIIDITKFSRYIDGLISPLHIKNGQLFLKLNVNTDNQITSEMWYSLYWIINANQNEENNEKIIAKVNVESPGDILLSSSMVPATSFIIENPTKYAAFGVLSLAILFGKIKIGGFDIPGIIPSIQKVNLNHQINKKAKIENDSATIDLEEKKKNIEIKDIDRDIVKIKKQQELDELRKHSQNVQKFNITIDSPNVFYGDGQQMQMDLSDQLDGDQSL